MTSHRLDLICHTVYFNYAIQSVKRYADSGYIADTTVLHLEATAVSYVHKVRPGPLKAGQKDRAVLPVVEATTTCDDGLI